MNIETRTELTLRKHDKKVKTIAISDDNNLIVTGFCDKSIRIWNRETKEYSIIGKHENEVCFVAISNDNKRIFSGSSRILK